VKPIKNRWLNVINELITADEERLAHWQTIRWGALQPEIKISDKDLERFIRRANKELSIMKRFGGSKNE